MEDYQLFLLLGGAGLLVIVALNSGETKPDDSAARSKIQAHVAMRQQALQTCSQFNEDSIRWGEGQGNMLEQITPYIDNFQRFINLLRAQVNEFRGIMGDEPNPKLQEVIQVSEQTVLLLQEKMRVAQGYLDKANKEKDEGGEAIPPGGAGPAAPGFNNADPVQPEQPPQPVVWAGEAELKQSKAEVERLNQQHAQSQQQIALLRADQQRVNQLHTQLQMALAKAHGEHTKEIETLRLQNAQQLQAERDQNQRALVVGTPIPSDQLKAQFHHELTRRTGELKQQNYLLNNELLAKTAEVERAKKDNLLLLEEIDVRGTQLTAAKAAGFKAIADKDKIISDMKLETKQQLSEKSKEVAKVKEELSKERQIAIVNRMEVAAQAKKDKETIAMLQKDGTEVYNKNLQNDQMILDLQRRMDVQRQVNQELSNIIERTTRKNKRPREKVQEARPTKRHRSPSPEPMDMPVEFQSFRAEDDQTPFPEIALQTFDAGRATVDNTPVASPQPSPRASPSLRPVQERSLAPYVPERSLVPHEAQTEKEPEKAIVPFEGFKAIKDSSTIAETLQIKWNIKLPRPPEGYATYDKKTKMITNTHLIIRPAHTAVKKQHV